MVNPNWQTFYNHEQRMKILAGVWDGRNERENVVRCGETDKPPSNKSLYCSFCFIHNSLFNLLLNFHLYTLSFLTIYNSVRRDNTLILQTQIAILTFM